MLNMVWKSRYVWIFDSGKVWDFEKKMEFSEVNIMIKLTLTLIVVNKTKWKRAETRWKCQVCVCLKEGV